MSDAPPNAEQVRNWNEVSGPTWVRMQAQLDAQLAQAGRLMLAALGPRPGERALDVGCGCGATSLALAEAVGPTGRVVGVDISREMLARAGERAAAAGLPTVTFVEADAQEHAFPPASFDVVASRFGVMFFDAPAKAFRALGAALVPGGRLAFVCWQAVERNPIMSLASRAAAAVIAMPPRPAARAPGPFAFAEPDNVAEVLGDAGFVDVSVTPWEGTMLAGGTTDLDAATEFALRVGPVAGALRQAGSDAEPAVRDAVKLALAARWTADGAHLEASLWIVTARRPETA